MDKEEIRRINRVTSLQAILLIVVTNIAIAILAYNVIHVSQSDFSKLDRGEIHKQIDKFQNLGSSVCIDASKVSTDGKSWESFKAAYASNMKSKCRDGCLCFEIT